MFCFNYNYLIRDVTVADVAVSSLVYKLHVCNDKNKSEIQIASENVEIYLNIT